MPDEIAPEVKRLSELAATIANWPIESLVRPEKAGGFEFESSRRLFENIQTFYREATSGRISMVPAAVLTSMSERAQNVIQAFSQIKEFNFRASDPNQLSQNVIGNLARQWVDAYNYSASHVAIARIASGAVDQQLEVIRKTSELLADEAKKASGENAARKAALDEMVKTQTTKIDEIINGIREAAKFEAGTAQTKAFDEEAKEALKASRWWMAGTILSAAASLIFIWAVFLKNLHPAVTAPNPATAAQSATNQPTATSATPATTTESLESKTITASLLQQTIARILIVTVLYSVLVWCARNYFAARHNFTVNRHRRNAMNTFRAFVDGTKDLATQDFILRQAAACAFAPQQSGYLKEIGR